MPTDFGLHHNRFHFQSAADLHGDSMKKKLDAPRPMDRSPLADPSRRQFADRRLAPSPNIPVRLPIHTRSALDSESTFPESAYAASFRQFPPRDGADVDRSPMGRTRRNNSGDSTASQGHDYTGAEDMEIDEVHSATGHKRRAASPPRAERLPHGAITDGRRRDLGTRGSPTPRLSVLPGTSSLSSMSSAAISRSNSYISTMSTALSSITTNNSFGRRSPGPSSPTDMSHTSCSSPYTTPTSLAHSPHASVSSRPNAHNRGLSAGSPRKLADLQKPGGSRVQRVYMCECCPKKPRKFDTAEGLR